MKIGLWFLRAVTAVICGLAPLRDPGLVWSPDARDVAIYVAAASLKWKYATLAVCVYILIGLVGVPVFSNFGAGVPRIVGPTGGFIVGYVPMVVVIGLIVDKFEDKIPAYPAAMVFGTIPLYASERCGIPSASAVPFTAALSVCVLPFLIGDAIKIVLAAVIAPTIRRTLKKRRG
jgi:biotin transport system substrate-specific component